MDGGNMALIAAGYRRGLAALTLIFTGVPAASAALFTAAPLAENTTCLMSITGDAAGSTTLSRLDFGLVNGDALIGSDWQVAGATGTGMSGLRDFWIQLKECNQWDSAGKTVPKITMTGELYTAPGGPENTTLFRSGGTGKGFGVLVYDRQNGINFGSDQRPNGYQILVPQAPDTGFLQGSYTIPMAAGVSCGAEDWCVPQRLGTGTVTAHVNFELQYP
ncbi:P pilus assembly protein, pilin FimA [Cedecea lapagei]|uniref:P pilus assembly protein, pilin FimA n=2 Tax=Cedecea lapagei TaxID=158823 RepID=A0A3S4IRB1_9ENTR|nr:P pilus assembly protein, pilin FimA [Cedecea lapagei]